MSEEFDVRGTVLQEEPSLRKEPYTKDLVAAVEARRKQNENSVVSKRAQAELDERIEETQDQLIHATDARKKIEVDIALKDLGDLEAKPKLTSADNHRRFAASPKPAGRNR